MSSSAQQVIALDIGGSSIKSAVIVPAGHLASQLATTPVDSKADADTILTTCAGAVRQHLPEVSTADLLGVAIGCPGPFDYQAGVSHISGVAKYESIFGVDIRAELRARLGMPALTVVFRNDAEAAIIGEARYGVGRPYHRLIGVTLGTGIGSAFVAGGASVAESVGVPPNGWLYSVPFRGVPADEVFSTRGLLARLRRIDAAHDTIEDSAEAAWRSSTQLRQGFAQFGGALGEFLAPFVQEFGAEAVLVLGGIAGAIDLFGPSLAGRLPVPALAGELGAAAPLLGAAELLFRRPVTHPYSEEQKD
jgi:glucokinase